MHNLNPLPLTTNLALSKGLRLTKEISRDTITYILTDIVNSKELLKSTNLTQVRTFIFNK